MPFWSLVDIFHGYKPCAESLGSNAQCCFNTFAAAASGCLRSPPPCRKWQVQFKSDPHLVTITHYQKSIPLSLRTLSLTPRSRGRLHTFRASYATAASQLLCRILDPASSSQASLKQPPIHHHGQNPPSRRFRPPDTVQSAKSLVNGEGLHRDGEHRWNIPSSLESG